MIDRRSLGSAAQKHPSNEHLAQSQKEKEISWITTLKTARSPVRKCKGDGSGEVREVLRWRSVVESIHMVGLVTFLSGLPASLTLPPVFAPLPGMMETGD